MLLALRRVFLCMRSQRTNSRRRCPSSRTSRGSRCAVPDDAWRRGSSRLGRWSLSRPGRPARLFQPIESPSGASFMARWHRVFTVTGLLRPPAASSTSRGAAALHRPNKALGVRSRIVPAVPPSLSIDVHRHRSWGGVGTIGIARENLVVQATCWRSAIDRLMPRLRWRGMTVAWLRRRVIDAGHDKTHVGRPGFRALNRSPRNHGWAQVVGTGDEKTTSRARTFGGTGNISPAVPFQADFAAGGRPRARRRSRHR